MPIINLPGRPGGVGRGPDGDDHAQGLRAGPVPRPGDPQGHHQEDAARAVRAVRSTGIRAITIADDDELAWVDVSTGKDDIIIATAQGKLARFDEDEVRPMGRDAAGVIGIRLARRGRQGRRHERRRARRRPPRPDRDRLRQARAADRVPAQASRRPGRPASSRSRAARPASSPPSSRSPRPTRSSC